MTIIIATTVIIRSGNEIIYTSVKHRIYDTSVITNYSYTHSETYRYTDEMHYIVTKYLDIYYI